MAELPEPVPVVDLEDAGIVRCRKCRTYVNPYMTWHDNGHRFKCNVCPAFTETPPDYYAPMGPGGVRVDVAERPELSGGTVEYVAPGEYMVGGLCFVCLGGIAIPQFRLNLIPQRSSLWTKRVQHQRESPLQPKPGAPWRVAVQLLLQ